MKILFVCSGNTCRSQMAGAYLGAIRPDWEVSTGGTHPGQKINPNALEIIFEEGLSAEGEYPKSVFPLLDNPPDLVISLCSQASKELENGACPRVNLIRRPIPDPWSAQGSPAEIRAVYKESFRKIRQICQELFP